MLDEIYNPWFVNLKIFLRLKTDNGDLSFFTSSNFKKVFGKEISFHPIVKSSVIRRKKKEKNNLLNYACIFIAAPIYYPSEIATKD